MFCCFAASSSKVVLSVSDSYIRKEQLKGDKKLRPLNIIKIGVAGTVQVSRGHVMIILVNS